MSNPSYQKPGPPSNASVIKWLVIGFLGLIALCILFIGLLYYLFTPIVSVDQKTGTVKLLGGAIDVQAREVITTLSKQGSFVFGHIDGKEKLPSTINSIYFKFGGGAINVEYNDTLNEFNWDCDGAGKSSKLRFNEESGEAILDLSGAFVECGVTIPKMPILIEGLNGEVTIIDVQSPLTVKLINGEVKLKLSTDISYRYDLSVAAGTIQEGFESSEAQNAIPIKVEVQYGEVKKLD